MNPNKAFSVGLSKNKSLKWNILFFSFQGRKNISPVKGWGPATFFRRPGQDPPAQPLGAWPSALRTRGPRVSAQPEGRGCCFPSCNFNQSLTLPTCPVCPPFSPRVWGRYRHLAPLAASTRHMGCDPQSHSCHWCLTCPSPPSCWFLGNTPLLPQWLEAETSQLAAWTQRYLQPWCNSSCWPPVQSHWFPQKLVSVPCSVHTYGMEGEITQRDS